MDDKDTQIAVLEERIEGLREAIKKAEKLLEVRLQAMNEFRTQLSEERGQYVERKELDIRIKHILDKIEINTKLIFIGFGIIIAIEFAIRVLMG